MGGRRGSPLVGEDFFVRLRLGSGGDRQGDGDGAGWKHAPRMKVKIRESSIQLVSEVLRGQLRRIWFGMVGVAGVRSCRVFLEWFDVS